jgi:hypothetical protein
MRRLKVVGIYTLVAVIAWPVSVLAVNPGDPSFRSTNYSINESYIGPGGDSQGISTNYSNEGTTLGDTGVGNSASANFQTNSGFNTDPNPRISFIVNTTSVNLGNLSTGAAATATATFSVLNYTAYGYVVSMVGPTPSNAGHSLAPLTTDTASAAGTEQFGVNTVSNTSPVTVGANPVEDASGAATFGYGVAGTGGGTPYAKPNLYRYAPGETIASAPKTSGITNYTMTLMTNISMLTPGGIYTGPMTLICTGTY